MVWEGESARTLPIPLCAGHGTYSNGCGERPYVLRSPSPQPSQMEAKGIAVRQPGFRRRGLERRPPCYGRVPQAHGAMNKNRVRRVWWDELATHSKVLYPLQAKQVYAALVCVKMRVHPGRSAVLSVNGLTRPQGRAIARQKSAEGIVVGGNELRWNHARRPHPGKGPNGAHPKGRG